MNNCPHCESTNVTHTGYAPGVKVTPKKGEEPEVVAFPTYRCGSCGMHYTDGREGAEPKASADERIAALRAEIDALKAMLAADPSDTQH